MAEPRPTHIDDGAALTDEDFAAALAVCKIAAPSGSVALGLSGGPDSLALGWLLHRHISGSGNMLHCITVDHDLRAESAAEAAAVGQAVSTWPEARHAILKRPRPVESDRSIMEQARDDRLRLMLDHCRDNGIDTLFLAHHLDDQAETLLFRLAKGSGIDGLGGMRAITEREGVRIVRPLLDTPKARLIATCEKAGLAYIEDRSNGDVRFSRPRLRATRAALDAEGATSERLATVARRIARASDALQHWCETVFAAMASCTSDIITLPYSEWLVLPEDIRIRLLLRGWQELRMENDSGYGPRLNVMERIAADFAKPDGPGAATLAGCLFTLDRRRDRLAITRETAARPS